MKNNYKENLELCERVSKMLEAYRKGNIYRCPDCGKEFFWNFADYDAATNTYACSCCKKSFPTHALQQLSLSDYLSGDSLLDVVYRLNKNGQFDSVKLLVSAFGPGIYIDTEDYAVKLYGLSETVAYPLSEETVNEINEFYRDALKAMPHSPAIDKEYVYFISFDWSTEDDKGFDFDICATPETAFALFYKRINEEKDPLLSWVGDEAFAEDGSVNEG